MKKIFFHVGLEKCGSTLIQAYMNEHHVNAALDKLGLRQNINIIHTPFRDTPASTDQLKMTLFNPDRSENGMFATQESFTWFTHSKTEPDRHVQMLDMLKELTRSYEVHPIIVVRRQDGFIQSLYNQLVKRGEVRDFPTFFSDLPLERYDWNIVCDLYAEAFGRENLTVIPMERQCYGPVKAKNFLEGMLHAVGLTKIKVDMKSLPILNPSLAARVVEVQRLANQMLLNNEASWLAEQFERHIPKLPDDKHTFLTDELSAEIHERYRAANQRLFETYMSEFDASYYL
ncbi:hypothetical protein ACFL12_05365 [Pseudomonadota bacterium]